MVLTCGDVAPDIGRIAQPGASEVKKIRWRTHAGSWLSLWIALRGSPIVPTALQRETLDSGSTEKPVFQDYVPEYAAACLVGRKSKRQRVNNLALTWPLGQNIGDWKGYNFTERRKKSAEWSTCILGVACSTWLQPWNPLTSNIYICRLSCYLTLATLLIQGSIRRIPSNISRLHLSNFFPSRRFHEAQMARFDTVICFQYRSQAFIYASMEPKQSAPSMSRQISPDIVIRRAICQSLSVGIDSDGQICKRMHGSSRMTSMSIVSCCDNCLQGWVE